MPKIRLSSPPNAVHERATFHCSSQNGDIQVYILPRSNQPFHLKAHSGKGSVRVYLPRDFNGPIEHETKNGTMTFSSEIRPHITMCSTTGGIGKTFVGKWETSQLDRKGDSDFSTSKWLGDHLVISSNSGDLYIQYVDEEKIEPALLKTLKGLVSGNAQVKNLLGGAKWIMKDKIGGRRQY